MNIKSREDKERIKIKQVLQEGKILLQRLLETEEKLQELILEGRAREIQDLEFYRADLQQKVALLEEKRKGVIPEGSSVRSFIKEHAGPEEREELLDILGSITGNIYRVQARQELNRSLLQERVRFSRELQEAVLLRGTTYNGLGQVQPASAKASLNLNQSC